MKKISRRSFLLATGLVTVGAALSACGVLLQALQPAAQQAQVPQPARLPAQLLPLPLSTFRWATSAQQTSLSLLLLKHSSSRLRSFPAAR